MPKELHNTHQSPIKPPMHAHRPHGGRMAPALQCLMALAIITGMGSAAHANKPASLKGNEHKTGTSGCIFASPDGSRLGCIEAQSTHGADFVSLLIYDTQKSEWLEEFPFMYIEHFESGYQINRQEMRRANAYLRRHKFTQGTVVTGQTGPVKGTTLTFRLGNKTYKASKPKEENDACCNGWAQSRTVHFARGDFVMMKLKGACRWQTDDDRQQCYWDSEPTEPPIPEAYVVLRSSKPPKTNNDKPSKHQWQPTPNPTLTAKQRRSITRACKKKGIEVPANFDESGLQRFQHQTTKEIYLALELGTNGYGSVLVVLHQSSMSSKPTVVHLDQQYAGFDGLLMGNFKTNGALCLFVMPHAMGSFDLQAIELKNGGHQMLTVEPPTNMSAGTFEISAKEGKPIVIRHHIDDDTRSKPLERFEITWNDRRSVFQLNKL